MLKCGSIVKVVKMKLKEPLVYDGGESSRDEFETNLSYVETRTMHARKFPRTKR